MALQPDTCTLFLHDLYENYSREKLRYIRKPMEDNWIFLIALTNEEALNLYSDAANNFKVLFNSTSDIPLKILMNIRNELMSYCSDRSSEDIDMDQFISYMASTIINLNYNIKSDCFSSDFQSMLDFHKCINKSIYEGVYRNIHNDGIAFVRLRMVREQKICKMIVYSFSEIYLAVDLFSIEVPVDDWKFSITVKCDKVFNLDSSESQNKADMPIKILKKIRNIIKIIMSGGNIINTSLEDKALDTFTDVINEVNYSIPIDRNYFQSMRVFRKWMNRILLKGIYRSIYNANNA